jgi:hypothetical protein
VSFFFFFWHYILVFFCVKLMFVKETFSIIQTVLWFAVKLSQVQYSSKGMGAAANREATCVCGAHGLHHWAGIQLSNIHLMSFFYAIGGVHKPVHWQVTKLFIIKRTFNIWICFTVLFAISLCSSHWSSSISVLSPSCIYNTGLLAF